MTTSFRRTFTPRLESLDDRAMPSATVPFTEDNGILTIRGDQHANTIVVTDDGTGAANAVQVTIDGHDYFSQGAVTKIVVNSGGGADTVRYELTGEMIG